MQIKKLPNSKIEFNVVVSWEDWKPFIDEAVVKISNELKVEGFRKGKAPRKIVEQKVGKESILNEAAQKAVSKSYLEKIKAEKLDVIGSPEINILKLEEGEDFQYSVVSSVMPKIKLNDYKKEIKKINTDFIKEKVTIGEEEINKELEKLAKSRAKLVTVRKPAKKEDSVIIDFQVKKDGVPIEGGTAKDHNLILGSNVFVPGFEEEIIGMKEGETKEFELAFPKEYHDKNLAGKKANFEVKLNLVQEREIPQIDDEFAQSLGDFKELNDLRKNIESGMLKEQDFRRQEKRRGEMMEVLVSKIEVEDSLPELLIHEEIHKMINELEAQMESTGMGLEQYLKQMGKSLADLEKDWKPQAEKRIKSALALEEIIKEKEIDISSEKVEEAMNKTLQYYKNEKDLQSKIDMKRLYDYTRGMLKNEEAFKMLEKIA